MDVDTRDEYRRAELALAVIEAAWGPLHRALARLAENDEPVYSAICNVTDSVYVLGRLVRARGRGR